MPNKKSHREKLCRKVNERLYLSLATISETNQLANHEIISDQYYNQNNEKIYKSSVDNEIDIDKNDNSDFLNNDNILLNNQDI